VDVVLKIMYVTTDCQVSLAQILKVPIVEMCKLWAIPMLQQTAHICFHASCKISLILLVGENLVKVVGPFQFSICKFVIKLS
jgi:hypothetical protein